MAPGCPIESTFATIRHRSKVTKGPGSRAAGLAMAFKVIEAAQSRWRTVNAPNLVALVRAGATFHRGKLVKRPTADPAKSEEVMVALRNDGHQIDGCVRSSLPASRLRLVIRAAEKVMFLLSGLSRCWSFERGFRAGAARWCFDGGGEPGRVRSLIAQQLRVVVGQTTTSRTCKHHIAEGVLHNDSVSRVAFGLKQRRVRAVDRGGQVFLIERLDDPEAHGELRQAGNGDGGIEPTAQRIQDDPGGLGVAAGRPLPATGRSRRGCRW
jgi:hypothetical protein